MSVSHYLTWREKFSAFRRNEVRELDEAMKRQEPQEVIEEKWKAVEKAFMEIFPDG